MLTKTLPFPSATANSGLPPRARVPATVPSAGVDRGEVVAAAVHGEDAFSAGIVDDRVGIRAGLDGGNRRESFQIEDGLPCSRDHCW